LRGSLKGRKTKQESRGAEFRARLAQWKQTPETSRPSLRALARKLGTSHQLLGHYLKRLEKWQGEECLRKAREIRARAQAENRLLTPWEIQQAHACDRAGVRATVHSMLVDQIERMNQESERRPLCWQEIKSLRIFAREFPEAQELLQKCSQSSAKKSENNLPVIPRRAVKSFRREKD
jgi:hypothetical protein